MSVFGQGNLVDNFIRFDGSEFEDLTVEEIASGPPEYSLWEIKN